MPISIDLQASATRHRVDGVFLQCVEAGPKDGPPVILLHGFPEFWWGWRHQIEPLAQAGFRVIVPDQRGYNLSDKPQGRGDYRLDTLVDDIVGLADGLGLAAFHVVGHDWGGIVAWRLAATHPERVRTLVAINAPHPGVVGSYMRGHPTQWLRSSYVAFFQLPALPERLLAADGYRAMKESLMRSSRPGTFTADDLAIYQRAWEQPGALTAMLNWYRALPLSPRRDSALRLSMPVLVPWGLRDRFLERGLAEASLALCERGEALFIESATHWLHLEEAERVNNALIAFMRRPSSGPAQGA